MKSRFLVIATSAFMLVFTGTSAFAEKMDQAPTTNKIQTQGNKGALTVALNSESVYGWELMSAKERKAYEAKMKKFKTDKERNAYLNKHHKQMDKRAKKRGVSLSDKSKPGNMENSTMPASMPAGGMESDSPADAGGAGPGGDNQ